MSSWVVRKRRLRRCCRPWQKVAPSLALRNEADYSEEGRLAAEKRLTLLDDVPLTIKRSKVGADQRPQLVMFMVQGAEGGCDMWLPREELEGLG